MDWLVPTVPTVRKKILMMRPVPRQQFRAFLPSQSRVVLSYVAHVLLQRLVCYARNSRKHSETFISVKNFHVCIMKKCKWNRRDVARGRVTRKERSLWESRVGNKKEGVAHSTMSQDKMRWISRRVQCVSTRIESLGKTGKAYLALLPQISTHPFQFILLSSISSDFGSKVALTRCSTPCLCCVKPLLRRQVWTISCSRDGDNVKYVLRWCKMDSWHWLVTPCCTKNKYYSSWSFIQELLFRQKLMRGFERRHLQRPRGLEIWKFNENWMKIVFFFPFLILQLRER